MSSQRYISDTLKQKKRMVRKVKVSLVMLAILLVLAGIVFLTRIASVQISTVNITGNSFVPTEEIQNKTDDILNSSYAFLIPKRNIFLFPKSSLISHIKENPAVTGVEINKDLFDTLTITITEQEKEAIYCNSFERTECFYINKDGYLYSKVGQDHPLDQEIVVYLEGGHKKLKETVLEGELYSNVISFIKSSSRYGIPIASVYVKSDGVMEFTTQSSVRLITSRFDELERGFANFIALFDQQVITKEQMSAIEYIDLRFGNKVFYKNKTP